MQIGSDVYNESFLSALIAGLETDFHLQSRISKLGHKINWNLSIALEPFKTDLSIHLILFIAKQTEEMEHD